MDASCCCCTIRNLKVNLRGCCRCFFVVAAAARRSVFDAIGCHGDFHWHTLWMWKIEYYRDYNQVLLAAAAAPPLRPLLSLDDRTILWLLLFSLQVREAKSAAEIRNHDSREKCTAARSHRTENGWWKLGRWSGQWMDGQRVVVRVMQWGIRHVWGDCRNNNSIRVGCAIIIEYQRNWRTAGWLGQCLRLVYERSKGDCRWARELICASSTWVEHAF